MTKTTSKIALIPGASRPIGRAIARSFGKAGYHLFLPYFDWPESVEEMCIEFSNKGYNYTAQSIDIRKKNEVKKFLQTVQTKAGHIDVLINNIERGGMPIVHGSYDHSHNKEQWQRELDTTLKAKWILYQQSLPLLKDAESAAVINISSIAGTVGRTGPAAPFFSDGYSAANTGISTLTTTWAREAAPNIRVNEIVLGFIDGRHGKGTRGWQELTKKQKKSLHQHILLKRTGTAKEVAKTVFFLATEASYITGASITMDGGYSLGGDAVPPLPLGIL